MSKTALEYFASDIEQERVRYLTTLSALPEQLQAIAERHFRERLDRAGARPLLGEYAPWLIADILGITDKPCVRKVITGWLQLYFFTMLLDDVIDRPSSHSFPYDVITAMLLMQRGLCEILSKTPRDSGLAQVIDSAFADTAKAAVHELSAHRKRISAFTSGEIKDIGQKIALLRICSESIATVAGRDRVCKQWLDIVIKNLAAGIQLLDDLTDWEEDFKAGNMTFPLTLADERSPVGLPPFQERNPDFTEESLMVLVKTGAIEETLRAAVEFFDNCIKQLSQGVNAGGRHAALFIEDTRDACMRAIPTLENARIRLSQLHHSSGRENIEQRRETAEISCAVKKVLVTVAATS